MKEMIELDPSKIEDLYEIADCHLKHFHSKPEDLIFNNPSLRKYTQLLLCNEVSLDYNLQPRLKLHIHLFQIIKEFYIQ